MSPGNVLLLNGVSSSGKSSIARQLLDDLDTPYFHMGIDMFGAMRSETKTRALDPQAVAAVYDAPGPAFTAPSPQWRRRATTS